MIGVGEAQKGLFRIGNLGLATVQFLSVQHTPQVKRTSWSAGLSATAVGVGVVAHAGTVATRPLADCVGLTGVLSTATARRGYVPGHDRRRVLIEWG